MVMLLMHDLACCRTAASALTEDRSDAGPHTACRMGCTSAAIHCTSSSWNAAAVSKRDKLLRVVYVYTAA